MATSFLALSALGVGTGPPVTSSWLYVNQYHYEILINA